MNFYCKNCGYIDFMSIFVKEKYKCPCCSHYLSKGDINFIKEKLKSPLD